MEQLSLESAEAAKTEAIDRVERGSVRWIDQARPVLLEVARSVEAFTTDRIEWELNRRGIPEPSEPRAYGALMRSAARDGWISKSDRVVPSVIPRNHRRPKAVWNSKLF